MKFNRRVVLLIILVCLVIILFLPIKVHYSIQATALIYPAKEWYLMKGADDSYVSELKDFETNTMSHLKGYKFERGDVAEVFVNPELQADDYVTVYDTIAYIHSFYVENELIRLKNLKDIEQASLAVNLTGEKKELIEGAEQQYEFAKQQLDLEEKNFKRQKVLFNDSIISKAEFELAENNINLAKINVQIALDGLNSLKSGQKSEAINLIQKQIEAYQREIDKLEQLEKQYYIQSPINGILKFNTVVDGICTVSDTSKFLLRIPVKVYNIQYISRISGIRFSIPGYNDKIDATFVELESNINMFSNQQMVMARAEISTNLSKVYPGMAVQCRVICDEITLFNFMKRGIQPRI
ncbi:MAG: hypothetical protein JW731_04840 [Bacteroidales bacterium]|nr:hypothetical protein [Bacteroidales bacterium]